MDIPDFILFIAGFDILVVAAIAYWLIKRKHKPKGTAVVIKPLLKESVPNKVVHRCPKCNELFEYPAKEIVYLTNPPSEKIVCPLCYAELKNPSS